MRRETKLIFPVLFYVILTIGVAFGVGFQFFNKTAHKTQPKIIAGVASPGDALFVYSGASNTTPLYKDYFASSNTFGSQGNTVAGAQAAISVVRTSPFKQEAISAYQDTSGNLRVQCYNGTTWTEDWTVAVAASGTPTTQRFDVAYETSTGDVTVAYSRNTAASNALAYRTKAGSSACGSANWANAANFPTDTVATSGTVQWVKAAEDLRSAQNLSAWAWVDNATTQADMGGAIWSGTGFVNFKSIDTSVEHKTAVGDSNNFDLKYESSSGDVMVVWGNSAGANNTNGFRYMTCTDGTSNCTWSALSTLSGPTDACMNISLSADPLSDKMAMAGSSSLSLGTHMSAGYWSGSGWTGYANVDTSLGSDVPAGYLKVTTGWLNNGSNKKWYIAYNNNSSQEAVDIGGGVMDPVITYGTATDGGAISLTYYFCTPEPFPVRHQFSSAVNPFDNSQSIVTLEESNSSTYSIYAYRLSMNSSGTISWSDTSSSSIGAAFSSPQKGFSFAYWRFSAPTVSGSLYDAVGGSKITAAKTIKCSVNGGTAATATSSSGDFTCTLSSSMSANDTVTVFVSGDTVKASTITKVSANGNLTSINLYQDYTTIRHEGSITSITNTDLAVADNLADSDLLVSVDGSNIATFTKGLYILASKTYAPGANTNIAGSYNNAGTFTAGTSAIAFTSTSSGKTLSGTLNGTSAFYNLTFDGVGGVWTLGSPVTVSNNLAITNGTVDDNGFQITGNATGTMTAGAGGTLKLSGGTSQTANLVQSKSVYSGGTLSIAPNTAPTAGNLLITVIDYADAASNLSPTVSDSNGNTWSTVTKYNGTGQYNPSIAVAYAYNCKAGATTITWANIHATNNDVATQVFEVSNIVNTSDPFDMRANVDGKLAAATYTPTLSNFTTNYKSFILVIYSNELQTSTFTQGANYTLTNSNTTHIDAQEYRAAAPAGTNSASFTTSASVNDWIISALNFKEVGNPATTFPTGFTTAHTTLNAASTIIYNGLADQTISGTPAYGNLQLSAASGTPTKTLDAATTINGNLTIDSSNTLDASSTGNYGISLAGNFASSGSFVARAGTVTLSGTGSVTTNAQSFYNLTVDSSSGTSTLASDLTVANNLTVSSGTLTSGAYTITTNNFTQGGGVFNAPTSADALNVSGNFAHTAGTFTAPSASTVNLNGAGASTQVVTGNTTFVNLTATATAARTIQFAGSSTQTMTGTWTVTGASSQLITLARKTGDSGVWNINPTTPAVSYVSVSNSTNLATASIDPTNSTDGGGNTNWFSNHPTAPSGVNINTITTIGFTVGWTDNSSNETGFKVYTAAGNADCSAATYSGTPDFTTAAGATTQAIGSKSVNTQYCAKVIATNAGDDSTPAYAAPKYTLANTPTAPTLGTPTISTILVTINQNSNPSNTTYAIKVIDGANTNYLAINGTLSATVVWDTYTNFGGASGKNNTGLTAGTNYTYSVAARNGDNTATIYGTTANATTRSDCTINSSTDTNGSISPLGATSVAVGGTQAFTFSGNSGYHISTLLIDGVAQTTLTSPYTFTNVQADHTISITTVADNTCVWTGLGADENWSTTLNWSGNVVPSSVCDTIFNTTSTKSSAIDAGFTNNVKSLSLNSGYSGTLSASTDLTVLNDVTLTAGTFAPGARTINVGGSWNNTGATFTKGTSTINFNGSATGKTITTNNQDFYNMTVAGTTPSSSTPYAWTSTGGLSTKTLNKIDTLTDSTTTYADSTIGGTAVAVDNSGYVWTTTNAGTGKYRVTDGALIGRYGASYGSAITIDPSGYIWTTNGYNSYTMTKIRASDGTVMGTFTATQDPRGAAADINGNIWVSDWIAGSVTKYNSDGSVAHTYTGIASPQEVIVDVNGYIWVTSYLAAGKLYKIDPATDIVTNYSGVSYPRGIATDANGYIWVANDSTNHYVSKFRTSDGTKISDYNTGSANDPIGVGVDASGNVWVTNAGNISKISSEGVFLGNFAMGGTGNASSGDSTGFALQNFVLRSGTGAYSLSSDLTATNSLNVISGTLTSGAHSITTKDFSQNGGTFTAPTSANVLNVSGNFAHTLGTFTAPNVSTVNLNGAGASTQVVTGDTTFVNLTATATAARTINFASASTQAVTGTWTVTGVSGQNITLGRGGGTGTDQWNINPTAWNIDYVSVSNSNNQASAAINPAHWSDVTNNTNWKSSFLSQWNTANTSTGSSTNKQITLPLLSSGTYDFTVYWGDTTSSTITTYNQAEVTHTYSTSGIYDIEISGTIEGWAFDCVGDRLKLLQISQWGNLRLGNNNAYFCGTENLDITATDILNLTGTTDMDYAFSDSGIDTVPSMNSWDMSGITTMYRMFRNTPNFDQNIASWDVSNVTDTREMFKNAAVFDQNIGSWIVTDVTSMYAMFQDAALFNQNIGSWTPTSVANMQFMFQSASAFNQNIGGWDVSSVTEMGSMFAYASNFNQDISNWDVSSVTNMQYMFSNVTLSTANYSNILIDWNALVLQNNVIFSGGSSKYSAGAAATARAAIIADHTWTITDGGLDSSGGPVNDSLTFSNPYSTNVAIADDTTSWQFQAKVTSAAGPTTFNYVEMRLANSADSTQPYDSVKIRWTEATDTFSEEADTQSAITLTSTSTDSNATGNQWTLDFKIKINNSFLAKDTQYAIELYSIDDSAVSDTDDYANIFQVTPLSLSLDVDNASLSFGSLLPGSIVTGTTVATVTTNYPAGYTLGVSDGVASSGSALLHTDASTRIADYAGTIATPTTWTGTGLGISVFIATGKDTAKWGTGVSEVDSNNKYAGAPQNAATIHSKTGVPTANDSTSIGYKLVVPNNQKTGDYSGDVTYTATGALP